MTLAFLTKKELMKERRSGTNHFKQSQNGHRYPKQTVILAQTYAYYDGKQVDNYP